MRPRTGDHASTEAAYMSTPLYLIEDKIMFRSRPRLELQFWQRVCSHFNQTRTIAQT
jgi:hypothetical protein